MEKSKNSKSTLPDFEIYKKSTTILLKPPTQLSKQSLNRSQSNENYQKKLEIRRITNNHIEYFNNLCTTIIDDKYNKPIDDIYTFIKTMQFYNDIFFQSIYIATDQNSESFFEKLEKMLFEKNVEIKKIFEHNFNDLKKLVKDLNLTYLPKYSKNCEQKLRLIILKDIPKINEMDFHQFLSVLINYQQQSEMTLYRNILLFDVSSNITSLYEKIGANLLSKMIINRIEYEASSNLYSDILLSYMQNKENLFVPNAENLKNLMFLVNFHQFSLKNFKNYFKQLIFEFFYFKTWKNFNFLVYDGIESKKEFLEKLKSVKNLGNALSNTKLNEIKKEANELFELFENIKESKESLMTLFTYLNETLLDYFNKCRINNPYNDNNNNENDSIVPTYRPYELLCTITSTLNPKKAIQKVEEYLLTILRPSDFPFIIDYFIKHFDTIKPKLKNSTANQIINSLCEIQDSNNKMEVDDSIKLPKDNRHILSEFKYCLKDLLYSFEFFFLSNSFEKLFSENEKSDYYSFQNFLMNDMTSSVVKDILNVYSLGDNKTKGGRNCLTHPVIEIPAKAGRGNNNNTCRIRTIKKNEKGNKRRQRNENINGNAVMSRSERKLNDFSFKRILFKYVHVLGNIASEFKLRMLFAETMNSLGVNKDDDEDAYNQVKAMVIKISHEVHLLGLISKKRSSGDVFTRNFYEVSKFFRKRR